MLLMVWVNGGQFAHHVVYGMTHVFQCSICIIELSMTESFHQFE